MALPKKRHSHARKGKGCAHQGLERLSVAYCPRCEAAKPPHRVCPNCGFYAGRDAIRSES